MRATVLDVVLFLLVIGIACQRSPQKTCSPPCLYNAPCVEGICQCPLPFEGNFCELDARERFTGTWEGRRRCGGINSGLRYTVWRDDSLLLFLYISGSFQGTAVETLQAQIVDPFRLQINLQLLRDTTLFVSGYAEQRRDSLFLTLLMRSSANRIDTCLWDLKKR